MIHLIEKVKNLRNNLIELYNYKELDNLVIKKFYKESFKRLTYIQEKSFRAIIRRKNSLIVAPTGSGKTESAIIPVLCMISYLKRTDPGIKCIYVTPQRSLNNDVFRRIIKYAESENLTVDIRHGDTPYSKRKKIYALPPDILITTPESLSVILVNEKMIPLLKNLEWVIIDEIHELLPSKRGSNLSLCLQRLSLISNSICRIGISATIGNLKEASYFLSGVKEKCAIFIDKTLRKYDVDIKYIDGSINDVSNFILDFVSQNYPLSSVLLFTNTRDESEFIGTILKNQNIVSVHIHHGSLSKEVREETENLLRSGFRGIVVCTSSLELGLDIGSIDLVIHFGSPHQVSKLIQRVGRSRHNKRSSAKGVIIANTFDGFIESVGIVNRVNKGSIERLIPQFECLDVLAHNIIGTILQIKKPLSVIKLYDLFKLSYPFHCISFFDILDCINLLKAAHLLKYDEQAQTISRAGKSLRYYYENVSTIPHMAKFEVIDSISKKRIGTLDQQFVGDYGEKGNVFVLRGSQWRILTINELKLQVYVEPLNNAPINIPYWVGEMIPVDYETAIEVGAIRNNLLNLKKSSTKEAFFISQLNSEFLEKLSETLKALKVVPNTQNIVVESVSSQNMVIIHSTFGSKINNTLGSLLSTFISSKMGYIVETRSDPYRILLSSNNIRIRKNHFYSLFENEFDIRSVLIASFSGTYNINWKVWEVAKRFGFISKEAIYDRKTAKLLYDRYYKTSISKESIRELIYDKFDVESTSILVDKIRSGKISIYWVERGEFSELAQPILAHTKKLVSISSNMESGVLELVKERLIKTKHKLICIRCSKWERIFETKDLPDEIRCPFCRSKLIASTFWSDTELKNIIERKIHGSIITREEENKFDRAWKIASLIHNFGKLAVFVLSGHGIGADTCARILRNYIDDDYLLKTIYETEKQYIMTRGFWNT